MKLELKTMEFSNHTKIQIPNLRNSQNKIIYYEKIDQILFN